MADSTSTTSTTTSSTSTSSTSTSSTIASSATAEASLASVYDEARKLYLEIYNSSLASTDAKLQEQVARCRALFVQVAAMINDLSLFSSNETKEDLQTPFFKYLLVPYYLGHIEQKFVDQQRCLHLREAQQLFTNFLQLCENYELCHPDDRERYTREQPLDPARRRTELLELAKREKQNKQRLAELTRRKLIANGTIGGGKFDESTAIVDDELDEIEREIYLVLIDDAVASAVKELQSIAQELPMVEQFERAREANGGVPPRDERMNQRPPPAGTKPLKLFKIPDARSIRANILRPHWRQPTVSLEEAADIDMQYALRSENHGIVEKENSDSEDDHSDDDEYYKKKREWDAFCDDNPAGSGNTYNRS